MIRMNLTRMVSCGILFLGIPVWVWGQSAAKPSQLELALKYKPSQKVEYSIPTAEEISNCKLEKATGGLRVVDPNGATLREFVDTNSDKSPDEWRYFQNGIEVYREMDTDADRKPDAFRWCNTAGTRWGLDTDADGVIDSWKVLSAAELSNEIAQAFATKDSARFQAVLLTGEDLKELGLGDAKYNLIKEKLQSAKENFATAEAGTLAADTVWMQFGGIRPSTFPAGSEGSTGDVDYYENASCNVQAGGKDVQVAVGTLVRVGNVWKAIEAPHIINPEDTEAVASTIFISVPESESGLGAGAASMEALSELDTKISQAATTAEIAALHAQRADLLESFAKSATSPEDRANWIRNLADGIMGAVQQGIYPDGMDRLQSLFETLSANESDKTLAAYVKFKLMSAEYNVNMAKGVSWMKVRTKWLEDLNQFILDYPDTPDTAEAMLQLGMETENDGLDDKAMELYAQIVEKFPDSTSVVKARGAYTRLNAVGKPLAFSAPVYGQDGKAINLASLKGRVIVVQFWTTWMGDASRDMDKLKELIAKYPQLIILGVNLDDSEDEFKKFLTDNRVSWFQVHEQGGMDCRSANALGIFNVPTILVIGADGNVITRNVHISEIGDVVGDAMKATK